MAGDSVQPEIAEVNSQAEAAGSDTPVGDLSDSVNTIFYVDLFSNDNQQFQKNYVWSIFFFLSLS